MELKEVYVENFKSLKKSRIKIGKFNVVVGANASGKSNLVEIFKLLCRIYVEKADNPFLDWRGYRNVVFGHKEELPIKISLKFEDKYDILFEVEISGSGGRFEIIKEIFVVADKLRILRQNIQKINFAQMVDICNISDFAQKSGG